MGEYNIKASKNSVTNKKIKYHNSNDVDMNYCIYSSNEELMHVKHEEVLIFANE